MPEVIVKTNLGNDEVYCNFCKNKIRLGEKFLIECTEELGENVRKPIHVDCLQETEDDSDFSDFDTDL